jgi:hypothetical protein
MYSSLRHGASDATSALHNSSIIVMVRLTRPTRSFFGLFAFLPFRLATIIALGRMITIKNARSDIGQGSFTST